MAQRFQSKQSEQSEYQSDWDSNEGEDYVAASDPFGEIMTRLDQLLASLGQDASRQQSTDKTTSCENEESLIRRSRTPLPDPRLFEA